MKNFWNFLRENFNYRSLNRLTLFVFLFFLIIFQSCKNDISSIGLNLKGDLLGADFTDTITLSAHSILEDSVYTVNRTSQYLGYVNDPIFGSTTASIYTQFVPAGENVNFGTSPQLDSIVLTLRYTGSFYGDTLSPFIIEVYELNEAITDEKRYYHYSAVSHFSENLTFTPQFCLYPKPNTKVKVDTLLESHIRIRLSDVLGNHFLQNAEKMKTAEDFKSFFKGVYICAKPAQGAENNGSLVNLNLVRTLSSIQLFYKNGTQSNKYSFFVTDGETIRFNTYIHNYEKGNLNLVQQVIQEDTSLGKKILYVQPTGGIKTKINFPFIKSFKDRKIIINKAELVITNIEDEATCLLYPNPNRLSIYGLNPKNENVRIPDDSYFTGTSYWGGNYDVDKKEYRFRITKYLQDIILRDSFQPTLFLVAESAASTTSRVVLGGTHPDNTSSRLRVEIFYTEY